MTNILTLMQAAHTGGLSFYLELGLRYLLPACISLTLMTPIFLMSRRQRKWMPAGRRRSTMTRRIDSAALLLAMLLLTMVVITKGQWTWPPTMFAAPMSDAMSSLYSWGIMASAAICVVGLLVAYVRSVSTGAVILAAFLVPTVSIFSLKAERLRSDEWQRQHASPNGASKSEDSHVPIHIRLKNNLAGADLWINGVHVGHTPVETTAAELFPQIADWEHNDRQQAEKQEVVPNYTSPSGHTGRRWGWIPLHVPHGPNRASLYYKIDLKGIPGYSTLVSQDTVNYNQAGEHLVVILDTVFPQWEEQIERLLDKARLANYEVDNAWLSAFDSYGQFGDDQIQREIADEPKLRRIRERRAELRYGLDANLDAQSAWKVFLQISDEAGKAAEWNSASDAGIAVDLLASKLDPQQLINYATQLIRSADDFRSGDVMYSANQWGTSGSNHGVEVSLYPVAQALWRLDQELNTAKPPYRFDSTELDQQRRNHGPSSVLVPDTDGDNAVERLITPEILRKSYTNQNLLKYAGLLGGSHFERFLLRSDWQSPAHNPFDGVHVGDFQNYVNKTFHKLMWLQSPTGTKFRHMYQERLLQIADKGVRDFDLHSGSLSQDLDFLFLDRTWTADKPTLAMKFWENIDRKAKAAPTHAQQQLLTLRWTYLARLWPESSPEMFTSALNEATARSDYVNIPDLSRTLSPEDLFTILTAVLETEQDRVAALPEDDDDYGGPQYKGRQVIGQLQRMVYHLNCSQAAEKLLADLSANEKHQWWAQLPQLLQFDTSHDTLLKLMVESGEPKLQLMVLPAIQQHPVETRRRLLDQLRQSDNPSVQHAAGMVKQHLEQLQTEPLPVLSLP